MATTTKEKPLGRDKALDAAIDFTASAAAKELVLFARYSDSPELVRPEDRPGFDAVQTIIGNGRHGAAMLFRYAEGHVGWSEVDSSLCTVGVICAGKRQHIDSILGAAWRYQEITADIAARLRKRGLAEA